MFDTLCGHHPWLYEWSVEVTARMGYMITEKCSFVVNHKKWVINQGCFIVFIGFIDEVLIVYDFIYRWAVAPLMFLCPYLWSGLMTITSFCWPAWDLLMQYNFPAPAHHRLLNKMIKVWDSWVLAALVKPWEFWHCVVPTGQVVNYFVFHIKD